MPLDERVTPPCLHGAILAFDAHDTLELSSYEHLGSDCLECAWRSLEGELPAGWRLGVERLAARRYRVIAGTPGSSVAAEASTPAGAIARLRAALREGER